MIRRFTFILLAVLALALPCCTSVPDAQTRADLSRKVYPADASWGPDLDIVIHREGKVLRIANRMPWDYRDMELWLNQQYVTPVDTLKVGSGQVYALSGFVNQYEELFPRGGFFRPGKGFPVVLAELYDPKTDVRYHLTVQPMIAKDIKEIALSSLHPD